MRLILITCALLAVSLSTDSAAQNGDAIGEPSDPLLQEAIRSGDLGAIQSLLQSGADPNTLLELQGMAVTPLMFALGSEPEGLPEVVRLLLEAGADPNLQIIHKRGEKIAPLVGALSSLDVAQLLLEAGADPNVGMEGGADPGMAMFGGPMVMTPLTMVLMDGGVDAVRLLLAAGADPNLPAMMSGAVHTPLFYAVEFMQMAAGRSVQLVRMLLEAGADPNAPFEPSNPFESDVDAFQATPLLWTVSAGDSAPAETSEIVHLLLAAGADPNSGEQMIDGKWASPLAIALGVGNREVALLLREAGAREAPEGAAEIHTPAAGADALDEVPVGLFCGDEKCFQERFSTCTTGTLFITPEVIGTQVRYEILNMEEQGCLISMTYMTIPNPGWEGKELMLTLNPNEPFLDEVMLGMNSCMTERESRFDCDGPLFEILFQFGTDGG
jgi:uncharacterized protein